MIWQALPYVISGLILLNLLFIIVLMGISAWECYQNPRLIIEDGPREGTMVLIYGEHRSMPIPIDASPSQWQQALEDVVADRHYSASHWPRSTSSGLAQHMDTLKDPADLCDGSWRDPGSKWEVEDQMFEECEYQTNYGRRMRGDS